MRASDLTYKDRGRVTNEKEIEGDTAHFVGILLDEHQCNEIPKLICDGAKKRYRSIDEGKLNESLSCRYEIAKNRLLVSHQIKNEQIVRFTYAEYIIRMLCIAHGYKLDLEDTIEKSVDSISTTSDNSKADYVCYILTKNTKDKSERVAVVILETKYLDSINDGAIAQVLGYYCKSQGTSTPNQQGSAILFNVTKKGNIEIVVFLFPYLVGDTFGTQSLMLPLYKGSHKAFTESKFLEFMLLLTYNDPKLLFELPLPHGFTKVAPDETIYVFTREEEMRNLKQEKEEIKQKFKEEKEKFKQENDGL